MDTTPAKPTIILVPGHWLGGWAWDALADDLEGRGFAVTAITLPGLDPYDPDRLSRTPEDQAAALLAVVERSAAASGRSVVLVVHSGGNHPATVALDRRPDLVARVLWVDSGPVAHGAVFSSDIPPGLVELPLPPFDTLRRQASLDGLDEAALAMFRQRAVPEPGPILRQPATLTNDARRDVPATLVCCSFTSKQVLAMAASGHPMMAEVGTLRDATTVDLPTGHWPMWSRPHDLADVIANAADESNREERQDL